MFLDVNLSPKENKKKMKKATNKIKQRKNIFFSTKSKNKTKQQ